MPWLAKSFYICDSFADVQTISPAVGSSVALCLEEGRECFYRWKPSTNGWVRVAGKFTSVDPASGLSMTGGVLALDPSGIGVASSAELSAAQAACQPLDSDLTAIAALSTTSFGRALLTLADAAALRTSAGLDPYCTNYRDRVTTTGNVVTVVRSLTMAINSLMFVDVIATFQDTVTHLTGGYIWATLAYARGPSGAPIACGSLDILTSHNLTGPAVTFVSNPITNSVDIAVAGKNATSISWSVRTTADRGSP